MRPHPGAVEWGTPVDGLRLGVATGDARIVLALENVGADDFYVNLGWSIANGQVMVPCAFGLEVEEATGPPRRFGCHYHGMIAGRLDDLLVPMPGGAVFTLRLPEGRFRDEGPGPGVLELRGLRGVVATLTAGRPELLNLDTPGIATFQCWTGALRSAVVRPA
jgi:hypothetical protein